MHLFSYSALQAKKKELNDDLVVLCKLSAYKEL